MCEAGAMRGFLGAFFTGISALLVFGAGWFAGIGLVVAIATEPMEPWQAAVAGGMAFGAFIFAIFFTALLGFMLTEDGR
jgi:hypothetical protein